MSTVLLFWRAFCQPPKSQLNNSINGGHQLGGGDLRLLSLPLWPTDMAWAIVWVATYWCHGCSMDALTGGKHNTEGFCNWIFQSSSYFLKYHPVRTRLIFTWRVTCTTLIARYHWGFINSNHSHQIKVSWYGWNLVLHCMYSSYVAT